MSIIILFGTNNEEIYHYKLHKNVNNNDTNKINLIKKFTSNSYLPEISSSQILNSINEILTNSDLCKLIQTLNRLQRLRIINGLNISWKNHLNYLMHNNFSL